MGLIASLGPGRVALDTSVFIYFIQEHSEYLPVVMPLFREVARGGREVVTSAITLLEVLGVPYRSANVALVERYEGLLTRSRGVRLVELDRVQLRGAAQLRARFRLRTPDALQLAAAITEQCKAFVTNDRSFPALPGLRIVQLRDHLRLS